MYKLVWTNLPKGKNFWHCCKFELSSFSIHTVSRCQTVAEAVGFYSAFHLQNTLETTKGSSVQSVFICVRQQWSSVGKTIIHTASRGHWSTGKKTWVSHWGTQKWRCCIVEEDGDGNSNHQPCCWFKCPFVFIFSHANALNADDRCGTMSPYSSELYIVDVSHKGYIWISLLRHNTLSDCVLHNLRGIIMFLDKYVLCRWVWTVHSFLVFLSFFKTWWSEKEVVRIKDMCSAAPFALTHSKNSNILSSKPCQSRSLKCIKSTIRLSHLFYQIFHCLILTQYRRWFCHNHIYF